MLLPDPAMLLPGPAMLLPGPVMLLLGPATPAACWDVQVDASHLHKKEDKLASLLSLILGWQPLGPARLQSREWLAIVPCLGLQGGHSLAWKSVACVWYVFFTL